MQDPNEDTEWNDILRKHGILPEKSPNVTEEMLADMIEKTVEEKKNPEFTIGKLSLEELSNLEDDEDEVVIQHYRRKRLEELKQKAALNKFGEVEEINAVNYVEKVNKAGKGVWVFLHLYKQGIPVCTLINQYLEKLAIKYPQIKLLKSISTTCIPNYPDGNLPTIFAYFEGQMKKQFIHEFGENLKYDDLEWMLSRTKAFETDIEEDPRSPRPKDVLMSSFRRDENKSDDDNDW